MPDRVFTYRNPWLRILVDLVVIGLLFVAVFQQRQNQDFESQIRNSQASFVKEQIRVNNRFADVLTQGCVASNGARLSLRNLLVAVQAATVRDPNTPPAQKRQSLHFFQKQINNIQLTDCSKYRKATN